METSMLILMNILHGLRLVRDVIIEAIDARNAYAARHPGHLGGE
jgi:hypothetical protein